MKKIDTIILQSAFLTIGFCLSLSPIVAQDLSEVIPPSPEAAAIGKYGEYPVGMYTGVPNISIPITELNGKSLSVPVNISYHASGIRVDEIASWVGLGWSLNAGGVITRTVRGQHDDYGGSGFYYATPKHSADIGNDMSSYNYLDLASRGDKDTESDYYFYNFNGRSGKFLLDDNKEPFLIPKSGIEVDLSNFPISITIKDEQGDKYNFEEREQLTVGDGTNSISYTSAWYLTSIVASGTRETINFYYSTDNEYVEHTLLHQEVIGDKYILTDLGTGSLTMAAHDRYIPLSQVSRGIRASRLSSIVSVYGKLEFIHASGRQDLPSTRLSAIKVYNTTTANLDYQLVKEFHFQNDAYFSNNGWDAINPADPLQHRLKLEALVESNAIGKIVKRHRFDYNESLLLPPKGSYAQDHWGYYNGINSNASLVPHQVVGWQGHTYTVGQADRNPVEKYTKACILEKIHYPTGGFTEFGYESNKYNSTAAIEQSASASAAEMNNTTSLLTETKLITPTKSGWARLSTTCSNVTDAEPFFSNITLKEQSSTSYLVNHIYSPYSFPGSYDQEFIREYDIYLTEGISYELEAQAKGNSDSPEFGGAAYALSTLTWNEDGPAGIFKKAGGLRVASIKSYATQNANPVVRTFEYGIDENGAGLLLMPNDDLGLYSEEKTHRLGYQEIINGTPQGCHYSSTQRRSFYGSTVYNLTSLSGSPVVYQQVTEYNGDLSHYQGKTIHEFDVEQDIFMPVASAYKNGTIQLNTSWKGGQKRFATRKKNDVAGTVVQLDNTAYGIKSRHLIKSFKVGDLYNHTGCRLSTTDVHTEFYWFDYPIESGAKLLGHRELKTYPSDMSTEEVTVRENFTYDDNDFQLLKKEVHKTDGGVQATEYKYPKHYTYTTNSTLDKMVARNMIALPIETIEMVNGAVVKSIATKYVHDTTSDLILPSEIYSYETITPGLNFSSSIDGQTFSDYEKRATILSRDSEGNVLEQQMENDVITTFVWGYNHTLPIAQITGTSFAAVQSLLGGATGIANLQDDTGSALQTTLDILRTHATMQDALVNTYTYEPGKGISSQTDPSGITIYYEYDDFGRLSQIKDTDGNIVKKYEYNFKNFSN